MQQKITFSELCTLIAVRTGLTRKDVDTFLRSLFGTMAEALEAGEQVRLKGLGAFKVQQIEERKSVDVNTGKSITLPARSKLTFIPAKDLANAVNAPFAVFEAMEIDDDFPEEALENWNDNPVVDEKPKESPVQDKGTSSISEEEKADSAKRTSESLAAVKTETVAPLAPFITATESRKETTDVEEKAANQSPTENEAYTSTEPEAEEGTVSVTGDEPVEPELENSEEEEPTTYVINNVSEQEEVEYATEDDINNDSSTEDATTEEPADTDTPQERAPTEEVYMDEPPLRHNRRRNRKRRIRVGFVVGFMCALLAIAVVGILILLLCPDMANRIQTRLWGEKVYEEYVDTTATDTTANVMNIAASTDTVTQPAVPTTTAVEENPAPTQPSDAKKVYDTVTTTRYLTTISREHYGNTHFWPYIYEENKAILGHPNRIKPGTKVVVPDLAKYGVDPKNAADLAEAKRREAEIYSRYTNNTTSSKTSAKKSKK